MDDMRTFEQQLGSGLDQLAGPHRPVDAMAISRTVIASTPSHKWSVQPLFSATRFVLAAAIVALFGGFLLVAQFSERRLGVPGAAPGDPGTFSPTGSLAQPRSGHSATLLPDGRVLVVGGANPWHESIIETAEIWDPATETFGPTGAPAELRANHTATLLPDGRVLVVGGFGNDGPFAGKLASAEIWDPATASFSPAGSLAQPPTGHSATLLADGRVLVFGGTTFPAEVWDPATGTFSPAGSQALDGPISSATLLADGRVLVISDKDPTSAEIWDPDTDTSSPAGSLALDGPISSATLLADGRVLVIGGEDPTSAEVWDPVTASFSPAGSLALGRGLSEGERGAYSATALPDGRVLIAGGCTIPSSRAWDPSSWACQPGLVDSAEVWDAVTNTFGPTGSLAAKRTLHTATALPDGRVLVVGGWGDGMLLALAEIWEPSDG